MANPINEDFANFELSVDQLDEITGGGWFSHAVHWVGHQVSSAGHAVGKFFTNPVVAGLAGAIVLVGGVIVGGNAAKAK